MWCGDLNQRFFCALKSLNAIWSIIWSWILSLYHLINRLSKQDFTLSSLNLHWALKLDKKMEVKSNLHAVKNHYSGIWQAETCIQSLLRHKYRFNTNFLNVTSNCNCTVFSTFSTFSLQSLKNQLSDKALFQAFEVWNFSPGLCFRDWNRYFYQDRKSMSSICLNWEVMFVQDELSGATWNRS